MKERVRYCYVRLRGGVRCDRRRRHPGDHEFGGIALPADDHPVLTRAQFDALTLLATGVSRILHPALRRSLRSKGWISVEGSPARATITVTGREALAIGLKKWKEDE